MPLHERPANFGVYSGERCQTALESYLPSGETKSRVHLLGRLPLKHRGTSSIYHYIYLHGMKVRGDQDHPIDHMLHKGPSLITYRRGVYNPKLIRLHFG
jgi:hypothetical protein